MTESGKNSLGAGHLSNKWFFPTSLCGVLTFCSPSARPPPSRLSPAASRCFNLSLPTCLYPLVSIHLSPSTCLCQLVSINLSLSTCLDRLVSVSLSLSTCLDRLVSVSLSLSPWLHQLVYITLSISSFLSLSLVWHGRCGTWRLYRFAWQAGRLAPLCRAPGRDAATAFFGRRLLVPLCRAPGRV